MIARPLGDETKGCKSVVLRNSVRQHREDVCHLSAERTVHHHFAIGQSSATCEVVVTNSYRAVGGVLAVDVVGPV
jgi:hypothetical protein